MAKTETATAPRSLDEAEGVTPTGAAPAPEEHLDEDGRIAALEAENLAQLERLELMQAQLAELLAANAAKERTLTDLEALDEPAGPVGQRTPAQLRAARPAEEGGYFKTADAFRPWRVRARNGAFTGETEGFGFTGGQATINPLPPQASEPRIAARVARLNNLRNYDVFPREKDPRTNRLVTRRYPGYEVLTPEQYDAKYGVADEELEDELPETF